MEDLHYLGEESYTYRHEYSQEELAEIAQGMADMCKNLDELDREKKSIMSELKDRRDNLERHLTSFARRYREKSEIRSEYCYKHADYKTGEIVFTSKDSGAEVGRRAMNAEEQQLPLLPAELPKDFH